MKTKSILKLFTALFFAGVFGSIYAAKLEVSPYLVMPVLLVLGALCTVPKGALSAYSATELLETRVFMQNALDGKVNQNELRRPVTGALEAFEASTPFAVVGGAATIENVKKSFEQTNKIPIMTKLSSDGGTSRSCGSGGSEGDSAMITLTWSTLSEKFAMSELLFANNDIAFQMALRHNMLEKMRILENRLEVIMAAYLESNKSAVNDGTINTFDSGASSMNVSLANKDRYYNSIVTEMAENDFYGPFFNVHATAGMDDYNFQANQGAGNSTNMAWQLQNFRNFATNLITNTNTGVAYSSYIFVPGTVGLLTWNNPLHRANRVEGYDTWTTIQSPFRPSITYDLKIKTACTDNSGVSASRGADLTTQFVLSIDYSTFKAYTSNTDTGIYKYRRMKA